MSSLSNVTSDPETLANRVPPTVLRYLLNASLPAMFSSVSTSL
jgi:hypothetical protein